MRHSILLLLIFSSCSLYEFELSFSNIQEVWGYCDSVKWEHDIIDNWQTPEETLSLQTGDCEDHCILFMYLCNKYLGKKYDMWIIKCLEANFTHAVVNTEEGIYNDMPDVLFADKPDFIINYDITLFLARYIK